MNYKTLKPFAGWKLSRGFNEKLTSNDLPEDILNQLVEAGIIEPIVEEKTPVEVKEKAIKPKKVSTPEGK